MLNGFLRSRGRTGRAGIHTSLEAWFTYFRYLAVIGVLYILLFMT